MTSASRFPSARSCGFSSKTKTPSSASHVTFCVRASPQRIGSPLPIPARATKPRMAFTHIGNDQFASFTTTSSKSRLNFLELLTAGDTTHLINDAALAYMRERNLSEVVINQLAAHPEKSFANREAWMAHLERLQITALKINPDPVRIATEGALWGSITAQGLLNGTVIVSDGAGQFDVGDH